MLTCPRCHSLVDKERVIGSTAYCNCGWHGPANQKREGQKQFVRRWLSRSLVVASLALAVFVYQEIKKSGFQYSNGAVVRAKHILGLATANDWQSLGAICLKVAHLECAEDALNHALTLEPKNLGIKAALAQAQTRLGKNADAKSNFEAVFNQGDSDPLALAYYAEALLGLGESEKAERQFYRALSAKPNLIRAAEQLVDLLVSRKAYTEALSLIASLSAGQPSIERFFKARSMAISDVVHSSDSGAGGEIRLASIDRHHFLPIAFGKGERTGDFMIDTGASSLTVNAEFLASQRGVQYRFVRRTMVGLANGDYIPATVLVFRKLYVGPWELKDVEALICSGCQLLAGQSLLRRFQTSTYTDGSAEYLVLKR